MIEIISLGDVSQAEVNLILVVGRLVRVRIVRIHVALSVTREDGNSSE